MTKKARTFIFILFVFLFSLLAPSVIFYSQGYRIDFNPPAGGKKVVQTGGFYFKIPSGKANVYINGKLEKSTSLITNAVYIENLLPKNYEVEIKKEGYYSWKKNLEIKEKEVTEAKNIVLFPQNPEFNITDKTYPKILTSATSSDKKKVVKSDDYGIWVEMSENREKIFLTRFSEKIGHIFWLNDYYLIFNVGDKIKIAEIDNRDSLNIVDLAEFESPEIVWDKNAGKLYVISGEKTYLLENLLP